MKNNTCYNCDAQQYSYYAEENGYSLVKCKKCGLLFVENRPCNEEISKAHKQGKHSGQKEIDATGRFDAGKISHYLQVLNDLYGDDINHIESWLDVGCGHGEFLVAIQKYSSNSSKEVVVKGTEPNINKQKSARKRGLNVDFIDIEKHKEKYDVISMLDVYSHLPNPPEFIKSLGLLLNPGGELIIETGDTAGLLPEDQVRPFYLPDHLSFASEDIVVGILKSLNFEILSIKKYPRLKLDLKNITKELVKIVLPKYKSRLRYYLKWEIHSRADMYIRARLNS